MAFVVIDGDTVGLVRIEHMRLRGVNAPETHTTCKPEKAAGLITKSRLEQLMREAKDLRIIPDLTKDGEIAHDKYGRVLGQVLVDGKDAATILVEEGLATPYDGGTRKSWCAD